MRCNPVLVQCWASLCDAGPTLNQHRGRSILFVESIYRELAITGDAINQPPCQKPCLICAFLSTRQNRFSRVEQMPGPSHKGRGTFRIPIECEHPLNDFLLRKRGQDNLRMVVYVLRH